MNIKENIKNLFTKSNRPVAPKMVLNDTDKFYLAVAQKQIDKLTFVYSLACHNDGHNQYSLSPKTEIASFENAKDANVYYNTIRATMNFQQSANGGRVIAETMKPEIELFNQKVR